jgi:putative protease
MSAMIGQRSANRGLCAQSCRLPFSADNRENYALSLKDLSLVKYIKQMNADGVCSFKIEGRMKRPEYVAAAVMAVKSAAEGKEPDMKTLQSIFSRSGFTDGYYTGKLDDMFGIRRKEDVVAAKEVLSQINDSYRKPYKTATIEFEIKAKLGENIIAKATDSNGFTAKITGDIPQIAQKKSDVYENIKKQFSKLGDTIYTLKSVNADFDEDIFVASSEWNRLRRNLIEELYNQRKQKKKIISYNENFRFETPAVLSEKYNADIWVQVRNENQLKSALENSKYIKSFVIDLKLAEKLQNESDKEKYIISAPRFLNDEEKIISKLENLKKSGFGRLYCTNIAYARIGKMLGYELNGSFGLNITNSFSVLELAEYGFKSLMMSPELKISQINKIERYTEKGLFAYGRLPLMLTKNCPVKNQLGSCKKCTHYLIDRTKRKMPVYCSDQMTEIFNSDRIYLADKKEIFRNLDYILLYFTDETEVETDKIIKDYIYGSDKVPCNSTNGLIFRGVQ